MNLIFAEGASRLSFLSELGVEWSRLVSQGLMFVLLCVILYKWAFKPVLSTIDQRRDNIAQGLADAAASRKKLEESERDAAEKIDAAVKEASQMIARTRDDAKAMLDKSARDASAKAAEIMNAAKSEIAADRARMKSELKAELAGLVVKTAEAVLREAFDDNMRAKIANDAASKLGVEK